MSETVKSEKPQKKYYFNWYLLARVVGAILFHTVCPAKYHHAERLNDREGAAIFICNHNSLLDPVAVAYPVKKREVTFLGKKELAKNKLLAHIFEGMHMITVDRHNSDMRAMRACIGALRKGQILGIFPEGTRHHKGLMEELESGVALMAMQSRAPLVPIYITPKIVPFHRIHVYAGEAIDYSDLLAQGVNNDTARALLERITQTYQGLAAEAGRK